MKHLGYGSCLADPYLWICLAVNNESVEYYEYMLLYVDDCLCVLEYPREVLTQIDKYFLMKLESIRPPKIYLGAKVNKVKLPNRVEAYAVSTSQYVQETVKNVEKLLAKEEKLLIKTANAPLTSDYRPKCDASPELAPEEATYYQSLIGVVRWIVEMGSDQGLYDVIICCNAKRRSFAASVSYLCIPEERSQCKTGI